MAKLLHAIAGKLVNTKIWKELSFYHKILFSTVYISNTLNVRQMGFQTMIYVRLGSKSLKWIRSNTQGCEDFDIGKSDFVAKTQTFLKLFIWQIRVA